MISNYFYIGGGKTDVLKIVMCVMVVAIHTVVYPGIVSPILRCAVPMFFMISSYFFFTKYDDIANRDKRPDILKRYIKRNFQLYLFWGVVLLPFTVIIREWYEGDFLYIVFRIMRSFFFSSTFPVSWYIMASIIGVPLIILLGKYLSNTALLVLSLLAYLICCLTSNYANIYDGTVVELFYNGYKNIFSEPYNSYPVSLLWIQLGRIIANNYGRLSKLNMSGLLVGLFVSWVLLYVEYFVTRYYNYFAHADDCYVMLVPVCFLMMIIFGRYKSELQAKPYLRKASTIIFCCHVIMCMILRFILKYCGYEITSGVFVFVLTLCSAICLSYIIIKLEPKYKILTYSY